MNLLHWYVPLNTCTTLDEVCDRWRALRDEFHFNAGCEDRRYQDAILSFLANCRLPAPLKLGAVLACVSAFDIDLRLALGLLDDELQNEAGEWPAIVATAAESTGPCLNMPTADPWLAAFVAGRLAGLRDTLQHDGATVADWRQTFWSRYLELSCRWADSDGVQMALRHGAQAHADRFAALVATAEGCHAHALRTPYYVEHRSHADYRAVLQLLCDAGVDLGVLSNVVLPAAAAVDNVDMLETLVAAGADVQRGGEAALQAAASNFSAAAVDWLLAKGVTDRDGSALIGAIDSLNASMVERLLAAGANVHGHDELPLCAAALAQPTDLYNGASGFIDERADMIALLLMHGADASHPAFADALRNAPSGMALMERLDEHDALGDALRASLRAARVAAFGGEDQA